MKKPGIPQNLTKSGNQISWKVVPDAAGYVIFNNEHVIGITQNTSYKLTETKGKLKVCAVSRYGSLGMTKSL